MGKLAEIHADKAVLIDQPDPAEGRLGIGANFPPEPITVSPFDAVKVHCEDLLTEARNWADGVKVDTAEQAAEVDRLIDDLGDAFNAAETLRSEEKAPLDEQIKEIQDRFNVYVAPLKNKVPGKIPLAIQALRATVGPYRIEQENLRVKAAEDARIAAEEKAAAALAASRAADPSNLEAVEEVEELFQAAQSSARVATRAETAATKGSGLRSYFIPSLTDRQAACRHYYALKPEAFDELLLTLARQDIALAKRDIPGFTIAEERRAI